MHVAIISTINAMEPFVARRRHAKKAKAAATTAAATNTVLKRIYCKIFPVCRSLDNTHYLP
jgi:hypothetical protein